MRKVDLYHLHETTRSQVFSSEVENFSVLLKGRSLKAIIEMRPNFSSCFIVNNFEREAVMLEDLLSNKEVVHFVNRLPTAPMSYSTYMAYGIEKVVFMKPFDPLDFSMLRNHLLLKIMGKKVHYLPRDIQKQDWGFGSEYKKKFPNAGILSLIYALEILRPKNLWIFGLDFYQADYLYRRKHQNELELQQGKFDQLNLIDFTSKMFSSYKDTQIHLVTSFAEFPETSNVNKIIYR